MVEAVTGAGDDAGQCWFLGPLRWRSSGRQDRKIRSTVYLRPELRQRGDQGTSTVPRRRLPRHRLHHRAAITITGSGGLTFNLTFDTSVNSAPAGFTTTVENVARGFSNALRSTATINLNVGWGEVGGNAYQQRAGRELLLSQWALHLFADRHALGAHAASPDDTAALTSLSGSDPTNGGHFRADPAQAETLGLLSYTGNDGSIGFGAAFSYTFDPMNRAVAGYV